MLSLRNIQYEYIENFGSFLGVWGGDGGPTTCIEEDICLEV